MLGRTPPAQGDDQRSADAAARIMTPPSSRAPSAGALTFALSGTLGCALTTAPDELTLAIASPLDQPSAAHRIAWVVCIARDQALTATSALRSGDHIRVEGYIEPRRRRVGKLVFYSVAFIANMIERTSAISHTCGESG
jgi:hypothetical protein